LRADVPKKHQVGDALPSIRFDDERNQPSSQQEFKTNMTAKGMWWPAP
jgi:hypothetical protein